MAQFIFPDANTQDVCLIQDTTGNVNLVLNGNLASSGDVRFIDNGYARQLSFTSANDLSAAVFTIYGVQNGVAIIETINGPNATTVYSVNIYDVVTNITSSIAVTGISIGTGHSGFFQLLMPTISGINNLNYNFTLGSTFGTNVIGTTVYGTLTNIVNTGQTFTEIIANNVGTLYTIKASGTEVFYIYPDNDVLLTSILIKLTGSGTTLGNTTTLTFLQLI
jgi:hypothetical protein